MASVVGTCSKLWDAPTPKSVRSVCRCCALGPFTNTKGKAVAIKEQQSTCNRISITARP